MERHVDHEIESIRQAVLRMGGQVEAMLADADRALVESSLAKARRVIEADQLVDRTEKQIDEECLSALARYQPAATDLRFLTSAMKIVNDLERMGDSAVNIAEAVEVLSQEAPLKPYIDLPRLSQLVRTMVRESLDSFVRRDVKLAMDICRRDDLIDGLYKQLFRELLTYMLEDPKAVTRSLHLLLIARNLERVADHATNIAEDVIYYVEARDIRHSGKELRASEGGC
jgi:phosphate transport system protein